MVRIYEFIYWMIGFVLYKIHPLHDYLPTKMYIQQLWFKIMPYHRVNFFRRPQSFCEKLQWLKIHDHNPLYHKLVDKYEVKKYVIERIGNGHVIKTLGIYNTVEEIDYDNLPNQFVLKCTHDSGSVIVCKDKATFSREEANTKLRKCMLITDYFHKFREWAYKDVKPRIIAEEYIDTLLNPDTREFKITCVKGKAKMITICTGIAHGPEGTRFNDHFDEDGNRMPFVVEYPSAGETLEEKDNIPEMVRICEILSKGIPVIRIDLYNHNGKILFGEMTFYTWAGFMKYQPQEWDWKMGDWINLYNLKSE